MPSKLRAGARDYIREDNLARLVPAVARELHEAHNRHLQRQAEQAFRASEERFTQAFSAGCAKRSDLRGHGAVHRVR
jgi:hypothetical protein